MPKKLTQDEFVFKSREVHGDKFDYSKAIFINTVTKVEIICPIHKSFWQTPVNHFQGNGCKKCGIEKRSSAMLLTDFIPRSIIIHNNKYDFSEADYIDSQTKVKILCPEHGVFEQIPNAHLRGQGCPECGIKMCGATLKLDLQKFIVKAQKVHNFKYGYDNALYNGSSKNITITCFEHGDFEQQANNHLNGKGCPKCIISGYKKQDFIKNCKEKLGNLYIVKMWNEDESFIKVGISKFKAKTRLFRVKCYEIYELHNIQNEPGFIWDLEHYLHKKLKIHQYKPLQKFSGYTECYNIDSLDEIITLLKNE